MAKHTQLNLWGCVVCGKDLPPRRRNACSDEHKRIAKSIYDGDRYKDRREQTIARACQWHLANRDLKRSYDAAYRERTREHRLRLKREYARLHPLNPETNRRRAQARRARKTGAGAFEVIDRDYRRALERARHRCAACRTRFGPTSPLEWDHVIPIARGGRHSIGNLLPLCRSCNRGKSVRLLVEWRYERVVCVRSFGS